MMTDIYYVGSIQCIPTDELQHYGIKGMKWGVRRWQNADGTFNAAGKERYFGKSGDKSRTYGSSSSKSDKAETNEIDREKTKKGSNNAIVKTGASVAFHLLTGNAIGLAMDIAEVTQASNASVKEYSYLDKRAKTGTLDDKTGLYKKQKEMSEDEDMKRVNPGFKNFNSNTKNNCMLCSTAYELRRRGYDVTAQKDSRGYTFEDLTRWFKGAKFETVDTGGHHNAKDIFFGNKDLMNNTKNALVKQGNGARGNIMVAWSYLGGGHSMVYEVKDGSYIIRDCQSGKVYKNPNAILKEAVNVSYIRTDNLDINWDAVKKEAVR